MNNAAPYSYVVKFLHLEERTKDEFEYANLLDALQVIKETPIDGVTLNQVRFETDLILLLTSTFMYAGKKNSEYPEGNVMIMLHQRMNNVDRAVYDTHVVPFVAGYNLIPPVAKSNFVPSQRDSWDPVREKQDLLKLSQEMSEKYPRLKALPPVAEIPIPSTQHKKAFKYRYTNLSEIVWTGDQKPETD